MPEFPLLKTGVVAQYPLEMGLKRQTAVLSYVDGSEQRFPLQRRTVRRWKLQLSHLDEREAAVLDAFLVQQGGAAQPFVFRDPTTGISHTNCFLDGEDAAWEWEGEARSAITLSIRQEPT